MNQCKRRFNFKDSRFRHSNN
uniref:Uncharacterized protein n=1 Tax=Tetranychus urticae TaxID=32264 RepID=T1L341_TETUR